MPDQPPKPGQPPPQPPIDCVTAPYPADAGPDAKAAIDRLRRELKDALVREEAGIRDREKLTNLLKLQSPES